MTRTLITDNRGASKVIGITLLIAVVTISATATGAFLTTQVREEAQPDSEITESKIDPLSQDQVQITPLVGDDIDLDQTKIRIEFLDRDAPPAVVTNLQAGKSNTRGIDATTTETVSTGGEYEPITKNVTYYQRNGTTDQLELDVYVWEKEVDVKKAVKKYDVQNESSRPKTIKSTSPPEKFDYATELGKVKNFKFTYRGGSTSCTAVESSNCDVPSRYSGYPSVTGYEKKTVTETITVEYPKQPGNDWKQVYKWEKSTETTQISKYQISSPAAPDDYWYERGNDDFYRWLTDDGEPKWDRSNYTIKYETKTDIETKISSTKPGEEWNQVEPVTAGTQTYELDEPQPVYEKRTEEVAIGYNVTNTTQDVTRTKTVYVASGSPAAADANSSTGVPGSGDGLQSADQVLEDANENAAFLTADGISPDQNTAAGVGGTAGSSAANSWTQGESTVIQLDRPLLFYGERINVQIIDKETNSLVMDRNVRVQNPDRFQFAPNGSTPVNSTTPNGTVSINDSVDTPGDGLGDPPDVGPDPDNDTDTPSSNPGDGTSVTDPDTGDSPAVSDPDIGSGDGDGERKPKTDIDCSYTRQTAGGGLACAGDQTDQNDDSSTEGYTTVCEDINCAAGDGGALLGNEEASGGGFTADECDQLDGGVLGCDGGSSEEYNNGRGSSSGGSENSGETVGGGSSGGGHSSGGNGDSGAIAPRM